MCIRDRYQGLELNSAGIRAVGPVSGAQGVHGGAGHHVGQPVARLQRNAGGAQDDPLLDGEAEPVEQFLEFCLLYTSRCV